MPVLKTKNISKNFNGVKAVDNLSITISPGKITGLIGPNGSGKTTLINLLSGVLPADSGVVIIGDTTAKHIKPYKIIGCGLTRTFQNIRLFNQMTVEDNILIALTKRGVLNALWEKTKKRHSKTAQEILNKVALWEKRHELAINLSYGQRKLLEIGRALATQAEIYLLDEPFAGLFPEMRKLVANLILELKNSGKTVVIIEHSMDIIQALCDQVIVLDSGAVLENGTPQEVLQNKKVIAAYLGT